MRATDGLSGALRKRGRVIGFCTALAFALSALVFAPGASAAKGEPVYLALGDSISFGFTEEIFAENKPNDAPSFFEHGFVNFFGKNLGKGTTIINAACPGETSNSLIGEKPALGGKASTEEKKRLFDYHPCQYHNKSGLPLHYSLAGLSQLEEALGILKEGKPAHEVKAITLNIGSNDELSSVAQCKEEVETEFKEKGKSKYGATPQEAVVGCSVAAVPGLFEHIAKNIGDILGVLDSTEAGGGHYAGRIVVLGFYNPNAFVLPGSDLFQKKLNETIQKEVIPLFPNARYANPFPVINKGRSSKQEQASICKFTEMCNPNVQVPGGLPAGKDGDIHPSVAGYKAIAKLVNMAYTGP
jgi:lysophospholipase L1-like esterase